MRSIRLRHLIALMALGAVSGCGSNASTPLVSTDALASGITTTVEAGQLFCRVGPLVGALASVSGSSIGPVIAKGASSQFVAKACAAANGIAVVPPSNPGGAPVLVIPSIKVGV